MANEMMDYYKTGQKIRKHRKICGLSQEDLAEKIGISVTHMSHIETGNTKLSLPVLANISVALGVSTDELIFDSANGRELALGQLSEAIEDCTEREINIITYTVKALKVSLRRHC